MDEATGTLGTAATRLARELDALGTAPLLVLTGAGVSAASGLATFRGTEPGAIWREDDVELGTWAMFLRDPVAQWRWYLGRFTGILEARPNPAHFALADIERWHAGRGGEVLLVTQNIDTLHEDAGSQRLIKVHGTADRLRCSAPGCPLGAPFGSLPRLDVDVTPFLADPRLETLPTCPRCGALLRAHALFFDEYYQDHADYQFDRVQEAAATAALVLSVGTSHSVGVTELVLRSALRRDVPVLAVDPGAAPSPRGVTRLAAAAEQVLPAAYRLLPGTARDGARGAARSGKPDGSEAR
ncbi:MAG TPA: Sir2 family NAD-dependent protein deacetylase [Thermoanaerobaculia bacterium]|nr:Sir2 family NAD-dependent protein deacetylase [Thermoanaerobaculia bacterium]